MNSENGTSPENYNPGISATELRRRPVAGIRAEDIGAFSVSPYVGLEGLTPEEEEDSLRQAREDVATYRMYERGDYDPEVERLTKVFCATGEKDDDKAEEEAKFAIQASRISYWTNIKAGNAISRQGIMDKLDIVAEKRDKYLAIQDQESQKGSEDSDRAKNAAIAVKIWQDIENSVMAQPVLRATIDEI